MPITSNRHQFLAGAALLLLLAGTRGQHFATVHSLPSASWAVFFLAGVYLRPRWVLPVLLALLWALDFAPHLIAGASLRDVVESGQAFCLSPGYFFLLPAYAALWCAGRWYAQRHRQEWRSLWLLAAAALAGAAICELLSSGGFYLLSGHFAEPRFAEFAGRLTAYFPRSLQAMASYVAVAVVIHASLVLAGKAAEAHEAAAR